MTVNVHLVIKITMKLRMWSFFCTRRAVSPTVSKLDNKTDMVDERGRFDDNKRFPKEIWGVSILPVEVEFCFGHQVW